MEASSGERIRSRAAAAVRRLRPGPGRPTAPPAVGLAAAATLALLAGVLLGAQSGPSAPERVSAEFASAWERADHRAMRALLSSDTRRRVSAERLAAAYRETAVIATLSRVRTGEPAEAGEGAVRVPVTAATRVFGEVAGDLVLPVVEEPDGWRIAWAPHMTFPGVRRGETLRRRTELPPRAELRARDNTVLARGPGRTSSLDPAVTGIVGSLGPIPADRRAAMRAAGVPDDARVGVTGLERIFEPALRGRPGGELRSGERVLARAAARPGGGVRTTIHPRVQQAASEALAGRLGGVAAMRADGEVLALAGIAFSGLQPPGSTFKIVPLVAALEDGLVEPSTRFPVETATRLEGVRLENANAEPCGGTLVESFAESCNTVFAPLGARLGAERLVEVSERFGFNEPPGIPGAATSSIPAAEDIGDDLAVGSTAIGQGLLQATTLQMASVSATIAAGGRRARPTLRLGARPRVEEVTSREVAREIERMMVAVVREGTGEAAALEGVAVAGKTGTAELESTVDRKPDPGAPTEPGAGDTSAWFTGYAPAGRRAATAVAVLIVREGTGGATAAPAAPGVLRAALGRR